MFNMTDPFNEQRMLIVEQDLKRRQEMGIYQTPGWMLRVGAALFIALTIIAIAIVMFYWIWG